MEFIKVDEYIESSNHLGFWERYIYQFDYNPQQSINEILDGIFKSEILFKTEKLTSEQDVLFKEYEIKSNNHSYTDKIEFNDLEKLNFKKYKSRIDEIKKEKWDEEYLANFIKFFDKSTKWITDNNYQNEQIFFIDSQNITEEKLVEFMYYSYINLVA